MQNRAQRVRRPCAVVGGDADRLAIAAVDDRCECEGGGLIGSAGVDLSGNGGRRRGCVAGGEGLAGDPESEVGGCSCVCGRAEAERGQEDQDQAVGEIARVLKTQGDFVCQTTLGPRKAPLWIRMADRMLKFGYFYLDDLKERLYRFNFDLKAEERSNINYIFRAAKSG